MPLDTQAKIDLINTDPKLAYSIQSGPLPQDDFIGGVSLGADYSKYLQMRRDPHVRSVLQRRRQSVLARRVVVEYPKGKGKGETATLQGFEAALTAIRYEALCSSLLNSGQLIGFSVLQLDWNKNDEGVIVPTWQFVPQDRFVFSWHEPDNTDIPSCDGEKLDPKTEIVLVQGYELRLLTKKNPLRGERCPKNRFLVYTFDADESPWGLGLGYSIYPWYVVKREAMKAWLLHSDRLGSPPILGTTPEDVEDDPEYQSLLRNFENFLRSVSPNGWARLPAGFEAKVMDMVGSVGPEVHERLIKTANDEISKVVLGEVPFSDKATGSYAANISQVEDREASLIDSDVNILDDSCQNQLWNAFGALNYPNSPVPIVRRETRADDRKAEADKQAQEQKQARINTDKIMQDLGYRVRPDKVAEIYGEEYIDTSSIPKSEDAEQPQALAAVLGDRTSILLNFLSSLKQTEYPRANAIAVVMNVFGIPKQIAESLVPEPQAQPAQGQTGGKPLSLEDVLGTAFGGGSTPPEQATPQQQPPPDTNAQPPSFSEEAPNYRDAPGLDACIECQHASDRGSGLQCDLYAFTKIDPEGICDSYKPIEQRPAPNHQIQFIELEPGYEFTDDYAEHSPDLEGSLRRIRNLLADSDYTEAVQVAIAALEFVKQADSFMDLPFADQLNFEEEKLHTGEILMNALDTIYAEIGRTVVELYGSHCRELQFEEVLRSVGSDTFNFAAKSKAKSALTAPTTKQKKCTPGKSHFCQKPGGKGTCLPMSKKCSYTPSGNSKQVSNYLGEAVNKQKTKPKNGFPPDLTNLEQVQTLGGSTGAILVRDPKTGKQYVLKYGKSPEHIREEFAADRLYEAMGVPVPKGQIYITDKGPAKLTEFIEGTPLSSLTGMDRNVAIAKLRSHYAADAILANWDVIGLNEDNILIGKGSTPYRIDNGGSLRFRAQGGKKTDFDEFPTEIFTLRDKKVNGISAAVFGTMPYDLIMDQCKELAGKKTAILKQIDKLDLPDSDKAALRSKLDGRLKTVAFLAKNYKTLKASGAGDYEIEQFHKYLLTEAKKNGKIPATQAQAKKQFEKFINKPTWKAPGHDLTANVALPESEVDKILGSSKKKNGVISHINDAAMHWDNKFKSPDWVPPPPPPSAKETGAIHVYTTNDYKAINQVLRGKTKNPKEAVEAAKVVNSGLAQLPSYGKTSYRGTNLSPEALSRYETGKIYQDPAFASTSKSKTKAWPGNTFFIYRPKRVGGAGKEVKRFSQSPNEDEVLYPAGAKFMVVDKRMGVNYKGYENVIILEEVD